MKGLLMILTTAILAVPRTQSACGCPPEQQPWYEDMRRAVQTYCPRHDPNLVLGMIAVESCGRQYASSSKGARGYMQVMPYHFDRGEDPYATSTNLTKGCNWLTSCWDWAQGATSTALKCYTGGKNRSQWGSDTHAYPNKVLGCMPRASPPTVSSLTVETSPQIPILPLSLGTANSTPVMRDPSCGWRYTDGTCRP